MTNALPHADEVRATWGGDMAGFRALYPLGGCAPVVPEPIQPDPVVPDPVLPTDPPAVD